MPTLESLYEAANDNDGMPVYWWVNGRRYMMQLIEDQRYVAHLQQDIS